MAYPTSHGFPHPDPFDAEGEPLDYPSNPGYEQQKQQAQSQAEHMQNIQEQMDEHVRWTHENWCDFAIQNNPDPPHVQGDYIGAQSYCSLMQNPHMNKSATSWLAQGSQSSHEDSRTHRGLHPDYILADLPRRTDDSNTLQLPAETSGSSRRRSQAEQDRDRATRLIDEYRAAEAVLTFNDVQRPNIDTKGSSLEAFSSSEQAVIRTATNAIQAAYLALKERSLTNFHHVFLGSEIIDPMRSERPRPDEEFDFQDDDAYRYRRYSERCGLDSDIHRVCRALDELNRRTVAVHVGPTVIVGVDDIGWKTLFALENLKIAIEKAFAAKWG